MEIVDLSNCERSFRHGIYGGAAGDKDGILYHGDEYWLVKYPKSTRSMQGNNLTVYTTSPLSEYIGSHIFELLGYDVHETLLCYRNEKIAVACKDFQSHIGELVEVRAIKNGANKELQAIADLELPESATGDKVDLEELLVHFELNPILNKPEIIQRFWECAVIDIFIDNNDRNNGNWGLLYDENEKKHRLAPIYDNGNSFDNKATDQSLEKRMSEDFLNTAIGSRTAYEYQGHVLSAKKLLSLENEDLTKAVKRVVPKLQEKMREIETMILEIPETYRDKGVCSKLRKEYYIQSLHLRLEHLLIPAYNGKERC